MVAVFVSKCSPTACDGPSAYKANRLFTLQSLKLYDIVMDSRIETDSVVDFVVPVPPEEAQEYYDATVELEAQRPTVEPAHSVSASVTVSSTTEQPSSSEPSGLRRFWPPSLLPSFLSPRAWGTRQEATTASTSSHPSTASAAWVATSTRSGQYRTGQSTSVDVATDYNASYSRTGSSARDGSSARTGSSATNSRSEQFEAIYRDGDFGGIVYASTTTQPTLVYVGANADHAYAEPVMPHEYHGTRHATASDWPIRPTLARSTSQPPPSARGPGLPAAFCGGVGHAAPRCFDYGSSAISSAPSVTGIYTAPSFGRTTGPSVAFIGDGHEGVVRQSTTYTVPSDLFPQARGTDILSSNAVPGLLPQARGTGTVTTATTGHCDVGGQPYSRSKALIKLPPYDGTGCLETYLAKFRNVADYFGWTETDQFYHLCASLEGMAGRVLCDAGPLATTSSIVQLLRTRFGNELQAERFKAELRVRRRKPGETLQNMYVEICRLAALAYPSSEPALVHHITKEAFIMALDDSALKLKVMEREPKRSKMR